MHRVSSIICAVVLVVAAASLKAYAFPMPQPGKKCMLNYCMGTFATFPPRGGRRVPSPTIQLRTNAQRLADGLGPKPPMRRTQQRRGTPVRRQAEVSATPITPSPFVTRCGIMTIMDSDGEPVGYIGRSSFDESGLLLINETLTDAATVCFTAERGASIAQNVSLSFTDLTTEGPIDFPLLALIQGMNNTDSNLTPLSAQYLTFGGAVGPAAPPGSLPEYTNNTVSFAIGVERTVLTSVWTINLNSGSLTAQWTNEDGTQPPTQIFAVDGILHASADPVRFSINATVTIDPVTLLFIAF
ncbi:hypothetical protein CPC08DRAFT_706355 [Agrocybe pediades]|nr:hypothetical protein CPC08DRAFT_706355 [Agrocybe pediades]